MCLNFVTPEDIREVSRDNLHFVIRKLSLYNLSYLYDYYHKTLDLSSKAVKDVYVDKTSRTSWELENHRVQVNRKCMYNIGLCERVLYLVEEEYVTRNIEKRFFS